MEVIKDTLVFDVDTQIIGELGERLVTRNHIGLSELIKNAYDADSPDVNISLQNITNKKLLDKDSKITISDSGEGMPFDVIKNHWMTIGTNNKQANPISRLFGRPRTGNKGIGRFACQKLAKNLKIVTCAKVGKIFEHTTVWFNWEDFRPGQRLSTVKCRYEHFQSSSGNNGTILELTDIRAKWNESDYKMLVRNISSISVATQVRRDNCRDDPGFDVEIEAPEFINVFGEKFVKVDDAILSAGWGTLTGKVDDNGEVTFSLSAKDSSEQYYTVKTGDYSDLKGVRFTIQIVPLRTRSEVENRRNPNVLTQKVLKQIREDHSGIKLYLNSFRIYPYGDLEQGDDWLGITRDIAKRRGNTKHVELEDVASTMGINVSRAMLNHPGTRSLIGDVFLEGDTVKKFSVKMDREGLVETTSFTNLKKLLRMSLDWTTFNYEAWLHKSKKSGLEKTSKEFEDSLGVKFEDNKSRFLKAITTIADAGNIILLDSLLPSSEKPQKLPTKTIQSSEKKEFTPKAVAKSAQDYAITQFEFQEAELDTLRSVAATAPLLFVFAHEVRGISSVLLSHSSELTAIAKSISDKSVKDKLIKMAKVALEHRQAFDDLFELFNVFSDSTNFDKKKINFKTLFGKLFSGFQFFANQFNIDLVFPDISPMVVVPKLNEAETYSILVNLITNSIKSLIASSTSSRVIKIEINPYEDCVEMLVKDNGIGLSPNYREKVFEPFIYDPENKLYSSLSDELGDEKLSTLGKGSGLGLHIVRSIIDKHKGSICFEEPKENWKATVKVVFRK